jgi:hydrogenase nickel incorporation protein HypA/HybF
MHEASLAQRILAAVLHRAAREPAGRICTVRGWVAETEALSPDSLAFHFAAHARGTPAEGALLELRLVRVGARCCACAATYAPEYHLLLCPACGSTDAELLGPTGVGIETMDMEAQ